MAKKYYWIKLKTDFFNSDEIDFLLSQKNGCEYIVLYQMLCLNTANNGGELASRIGEMIVPYDVNKIVRDTKYFSFDTVTIALGLFKQLGLIYEEEGQVLRISNYDAMVGSNTEWAEKKRKYREKQNLLKNTSGQIEGQKEDIVRQEIEIDIEKEIDIDLDKDKKKYKEKDLEIEFEELWSKYPNKKDKSKALKYYKDARKKGTTKEEVSLGIDNYNKEISIKKTEKKYIKHGSTWFYNKCWEDEYDFTPPTSNYNNNGYKRTEIVPEWFNKEQKTEELTQEEKKLFDDLIEDDFETRRKALQERLKSKYGKKVSETNKTS